MAYRGLYRGKGKHVLPGFIEILQDFRCSEATNPLDHVYALLGLVAPDELAKLDKEYLRPNYKPEITLDRCFITIARAVYATSNNLDPLLYVHREAHKMSTLPSWVLDWSYKPKEMHLPKHILGPIGEARAKTVFSACGLRWSYPNKFRGDRILIASGYDTDVISLYPDLYPPMSNVSWTKLPKGEGFDECFFKDKGGNEIRGRDILFQILLSHGHLVMRCFGYMPEGEETAFQAYKEFMDSLSMSRRAYSLSSPIKALYSFLKKRASNPRHEPSKIRQALVAIGAIYDGKDKAKM
ncbi:hypothetical protein F4810DRAFT_717135 [Camillea tinctor]|nr:hypothetical protein F4810DRAFT_717135 [Camillea tinctor]